MPKASRAPRPAIHVRRGGRLSVVRQQIDRLDERLLRLINERAMYALEIGRIKKSRKWPVFDAARERFVLSHVAQANRGPLSAGAVRHIFQSVLTECRRRQRRPRRRTRRAS